MKKRRLLYSVVLVALAGLVFTGFAYGFRSFYSPEERIAHFTEKLTAELDLDAGQQEVLAEIVSAFKEKITELRGQHGEGHGRMLALVQQEQVTSEDVMNLVTEHHQKIEPVIEFAAEQLARFHNVLTAEQREKMVKIIEEHHALRARHCRFGQ